LHIVNLITIVFSYCRATTVLLRQCLMAATIKLYVSHIRMRTTESMCARTKSTFTAYPHDPEDSYITYKSGHWCSASCIFKRFSVSLGTFGTASVTNFVFKNFRSFVSYSRITCPASW